MSIRRGKDLIAGLGTPLPDQSGNTGKFLTTDGTTASWGTVSQPTKISDLTDDTSTNPIDKADTLTNLTATVTELNYVDGVTSNIQTQLNGKLTTSDIINNVTSTNTDKALSANMGKELQDQISNLKSIGKFLALWNCSTGLAQSNPTTSPYTYNTGDFFVVGTIASSGNNYKPNGSSYTIGTASTTVESNSVAVNDVYFYDGTNWNLQINHGGLSTVSFSNITGQPTDNTNLSTALSGKVTANSAITGATKTKITYDSKGLVTAGADLTASDIPNLTLSKITDVTATATEVNYTKGVTSAIQTQLNGKLANTATGSSAVAVGSTDGNAYASADHSNAIGRQATASGAGSIAIGAGSIKGEYTEASGKSAIAIGGEWGTEEGNAAKALADFAIQLGGGRNSTANTFQVFSYQLLDSTGLIPAARLTNALPAQSGNSGKYLTTDGSSASWADVAGAFVATYGTTTYAEITTAISAGKTIYCDYNNYRYQYSNTDTTNGYYYFSLFWGSVNGRYIRVNSSNTWSAGTSTLQTTSNLISSTSTATSTDTKYYSATKTDNLLSGKQDSLPTGTTGYFLKKTATGVEWAQVSAEGIIDQNSKALKYDWIGTTAEYEALGTYNNMWTYFVTDDYADNVAIDNSSITKNNENKLQTVGVINQNDTSTAIKTWTGTEAEYKALEATESWYAWDGPSWYAWINGSTVYYTTSSSPSVGDTIYDSTKTDSGMTVQSIDATGMVIK